MNEQKKLTNEERINSANNQALYSKGIRSINLANAAIFICWLLGLPEMAIDQLKKLGKPLPNGKEGELVWLTGKNSVLGIGHEVSCAINTTGRANTIKLFRNGIQVERFVFPSTKMRNTGIGYGKPQLMAFEAMGLTGGMLNHVNQYGKKPGQYWFSDETGLIAEYLTKKYMNK